MKLSEFCTKEKFSYSVNGVQLSRDSLKTENGELYVDEERTLYYRKNSSPSPVLLRTNVSEWIYFNDNKIVCSEFDLDDSYDATYICIIDIQGNALTSGVLTQFGLVYSRDNLIIKEDSDQKETVIFTLNGEKAQVIYFDDSFSIPFYYPHSDFLYDIFYDYDGKYLEDKTRRDFLQKFLRRLRLPLQKVLEV